MLAAMACSAGPETRTTDGHRHRAVGLGRLCRRDRRRTIRDVVCDQETDATGVPLLGEAQSGRRFLMGPHDDVLEKVAETGLDRTLVAAVDLEIVGHGAHLADVAVRLGKHHPCAVAVFGAGGIELFERSQPRRDAGNLLFGGAEIPGVALPRRSRRRQL